MHVAIRDGTARSPCRLVVVVLGDIGEEGGNLCLELVPRVCVCGAPVLGEEVPIIEENTQFFGTSQPFHTR